MLRFRIFNLAALCLVGVCSVALAARKPWSPDQKPASAPEVTQFEGMLTDRKFAVSLTLPDGWLINNAQRAPNQRTMVPLQLPGKTLAEANLYYRIYETPTAGPADAEAFLRGEAEKKEKDRARRWAEYRNRPDSFLFHQVNGRPALSWIADYKTFSEEWSECFTRVLGENSVGMLFVNAQTKELEALRPVFNKMAGTLRLP